MSAMSGQSEPDISSQNMPTAMPADKTQIVEKPQEESEYVHGVALYALICALLLVVLIMSLDVSIIATAIPRITDDFHTIADIGWYGAGFSFATAALQPVSGKIYTFFPMKWSFIAFVLIFELGSLLCATSVSSSMFIVGRTVAGIGASGLINGALSIVGSVVRPEKRPMFMGLIMSFAAAAQIAGPLIGGALTSKVSWRWCFYINLPVGGATVTFLSLIKFSPNFRKEQKTSLRTCVKDFDLIGLMLFVPSIIMFMMALQWAGSKYAWSSAVIIGLLCGFFAALIPLSIWEYRAGESAMFPFSLLRIRAFYSCCITNFLQGGGIFVAAYYLPLWFQTVKLADPMQSAIDTLPSFISQIVVAILVGATVPRFIPFLTPFAIAGGTLSTIGSALIAATFHPETTSAKWIGYQILSGAGRGATAQTPVQIAQQNIPKTSLAVGTAIVTFFNFFGGSIALAIAQTLFSNSLKKALEQYAPGLDPQVVVGSGATNVLTGMPQQYMEGVRRAYNEAVTRVFWLVVAAAGVSIITSIGMGWKRVEKKPKTAKDSVAGATQEVPIETKP